MEMSGGHTPKRILSKPKKNAIDLQNISPTHPIKRIKSFIPIKISDLSEIIMVTHIKNLEKEILQ